MVVLLTGASGFLGRHLAAALLAAGHSLVCAVRSPPLRPHSDSRISYIQADFTQDLEPEDWLPRLAGVDAVINAVGIIREQGPQDFDTLHLRAPRALFAACASAHVRGVIQISALGADDQARSRYHCSKKAADDYLRSLPISSVIVQPALVYGDDGASARLFATLASLPLIPVPGRGEQRVQPVHVEDVVAATLALLPQPDALPVSRTVALVGPQVLAFRDFLAQLRASLGGGSVHFLPVPMGLMALAARLGRRLPGSLLEPEALQMLIRGNHGSAADADRMPQFLGHAPRAVRDFIEPALAPAMRHEAQLQWLLPPLRLALALLWIWTGIVSLGLYPRSASYALLARSGIPEGLQPLMLFGAAGLDILLGMGILLLRRRRWLWGLQLALILFYTAVITLRLPEFWLHPYGPLLKNLPILAAILLLLVLEEGPERGKRPPG